MKVQSIHDQAARLPRAIPRFDIPAGFIPAFNTPKTCNSCLSELNLPNIALPRVRVLRVVLAQYGFQQDEQGKVFVGGLDLEVHDLDKNLARSYPIDITVLARSAQQKETISTEPIKDSKGSLSIVRLPNFGLYSSISFSELRKLLDQQKFDIIHIHRVKGSAVQAFINEAQSRNIPVVMTHHNGLPDKTFIHKSKIQRVSDFLSNIRNNSRYYGIFATLASLAKDLKGRLQSTFKKTKTDLYKDISDSGSSIYTGSPLVAVSEYASRIFGQYPSIVIGSAIDTNFFKRQNVSAADKDALLSKADLQDSEKIISYHARMTPAKGQIDLIYVAKEMLRAGCSNFHFVISGSFEDKLYIDRLKTLIKVQRLDSYFTVLDTLNQNEIRTLLSISSALAFPTSYESLGRTGIEAMLMGVPVIANNVGGIPGYIKDGETGFLVETKDYKGMAEKIMAVLSNSDLSKKLASNAEEFARQKFDAAGIAKQYMEECYCNVLHSKFSPQSLCS